MRLVRKSRVNFRVEVGDVDWKQLDEMRDWLIKQDPMPWWRQGMIFDNKIFHFRSETAALHFYMRWS